MEFENILKSKVFIICVIGPHASETLEDIMKRKIMDINKFGFCFWICRSYAINPEIMSNISSNSRDSPLYMIFIKTAGNGLGKDTKISDRASFFKKHDDSIWSKIPNEMSPVTGRMPCFGFCFEELKLINNKVKICLNDYVEMDNTPIKIHIGKSTLGIKKRENDIGLNGIDKKSNQREIIGYAKIKPVLYRFNQNDQIQIIKKVEKNKINDNSKFQRKRKNFKYDEKLKKKIKR